MSADTVPPPARLGPATQQALRDIVQRPDWQADALCKEFPDVDFLPGRGRPVEPAKAVCRRCLVRDECVAFALDRPRIDGVWGGTTGRERQRMRKTVRRARPTRLPVAAQSA